VKSAKTKASKCDKIAMKATLIKMRNYFTQKPSRGMLQLLELKVQK
jgi:ribosomal protein L33